MKNTVSQIPSLMVLSFFVFPLVAPAADDPAEFRMRMGIEFYGQGKWQDAVMELRRAQAETSSAELRAESLFWIAMSQLSAGDYGSAIRSMTVLGEIDPEGHRLRDIPYHLGRCLYMLGHFDDAIAVLAGYANSFSQGQGRSLSREDSIKRAAALYWIGESLLSLGHTNRAEVVFTHITGNYPLSAKYEASVYRLSVIKQIRAENELLSLLRLSHEEASRNAEEFRRRENFYSRALDAQQRQIASLSGDPDERIADLESENSRYRELLSSAEERIRYLENAFRGSGHSEGNLR